MLFWWMVSHQIDAVRKLRSVDYIDEMIGEIEDGILDERLKSEVKSLNI